MSRIPSFDSLRAKPIGRAPTLFKTAQAMPPDAGGAMGQGMGGVATGQPDEMQAPESADERQFEQDLSGMAYQFVMDRAPALLPYMLGFEVVDRSEDGSKAVGIFGYKIDDDFYYIPVFFINNQIRGVDMLFSKRTNSFLPLTEEWINYVVDRHAVSLGGVAKEDVNQSLEQPDLSFLRAPKNQQKTASAEDGMWSLKTAWHVMTTQSEKLAESDPLLKEMFNGVLKAVKDVPLKKSAEAKYINGFMRTVGGPEAQISLLKTFRNVKFANAALTFYTDMSAFGETDLANAHLHRQKLAKQAAAAPKLRVKTAEDLAQPKDGESARQILEHGFTIDDRREDKDLAELVPQDVEADFDRKFGTPTEVGKYAFVMSDGKLREGYLLSLTHTDDSMRDAAAVYFPADKIFATGPAESILVESGTASESKGGEYADLFRSAKSKDTIEVSTSYADRKYYLFIGPRGQSFIPIRVTSVFKDGDDVSYMFDRYPYSSTVKTPCKSNRHDFGSWDISDRFHDENGRRHADLGDCACCAPSRQRLTFCSGIAKPTVTSNGVILPDDWRVVEVASSDIQHPYDPDESAEERAKAEEEANRKSDELRQKYTFGNATDILCEMQHQGFTGLKIASIGPDEFHLHVDGFRQTPRLRYKEAAVSLVSHFGIRPSDAFAALDKTASAGSSRWLVTHRGFSKAAQGVGVSMPAPVDQMPAVDDYTGIPVYGDPYIDQQTGQMTGVPTLPPDGGLTRGIADGSEIQNGMGGAGGVTGPEDGMIPIDQQAQQLADEAAQAGQKHVFDQAAIGGLSKVYDVSAVVDSYIPNFMDSLDRLGRIMFLFYWKHDDFNARYGSDDVVEMEDRLRGVFKQLGDLTLKLKEKAVRTD